MDLLFHLIGILAAVHPDSRRAGAFVNKCTKNIRLRGVGGDFFVYHLSSADSVVYNSCEVGDSVSDVRVA